MSGITGILYDLPVVVKCVLVPAALLLVCSVLRLIANRLPSQSPPVFEGIPFVGGVLKFVQVCNISRSLVSNRSTAQRITDSHDAECVSPDPSVSLY